MENDEIIQIRDSHGRFLPGSPPGPGRPPRETEREYLEAMIGECPLDRWRCIVARAVQDAEAGDAKAREWLAIYLIGRPIMISAEIKDAPGDTFKILGMSEEQAIDFLRRRGAMLLPEDRARLIDVQADIKK